MLLACFGDRVFVVSNFLPPVMMKMILERPLPRWRLWEEEKEANKTKEREEQALLRNEFNNGEETATKAKTTQQQQQQQKQLKFSSNVFNFYRKNVAPKLGDFGSFARDMMNDKPPVVTNENEEREVDYDDIRSSGENVRGSW